MSILCECGHASERHVGRDDPDRREDCPCLDCGCADFCENEKATADRALRIQKILLQQTRTMLQRALHELDQMRGVAECAPQDVRETYDFEALGVLIEEANRVIMSGEEEVRI